MKVKVHLKNLQFNLQHKWFVLLECLKIGGVPLWAAIIHDWQKFTVVEWRAYALNFFGGYSERPQWLKDAFDRAWLHHIHYGPHHWQYWLLRGEPLEMPDRYRREMLADWHGEGRMPGKVDARTYYLSQRDKIKLHPATRHWIEQQLGVEA